MPSPFSITVPSGVVPLKPSGMGDIQFSITNAGDRALRGRAVVAPLDGLNGGWLALVGEAEHDFAVNGTHQYVVRVTLPPGTPPARRRFRLDVVGVENPDEVFTQGQAVSFENTVTQPEDESLKKRPGYVAALLGSLVGMLAGGSAGLLIGVILGLLITILGGDLDSLATGAGVVVLCICIGPWVGSALGVRYNLQNRGYDWATLTALVHAGMFPVVGIALTGLSVLIGGPAGVAMFFVIVLPACVVVPSLVGRATVWFVKTGKL